MFLKKSVTAFEKVFIDTENESNDYRSSDKGKKWDAKVFIISITVAVSLIIIHYWGSYTNSVGLCRQLAGVKPAFEFNAFFDQETSGQLWRLTHWILVLTLGYLFIPLFIIKFILKEPLSNYGLSLKNPIKEYSLYLKMLLIMIPIVILASYSKSFQAKYPFYHIYKKNDINSYFFIWEIEYFFQFFALEFFFRGFLLHGIKHRLGFYSVFFMTIPYCMIHFGKPMPEAIAAIIAGIILGTLSLKSKNIWLGVLIHCSVALTMDLCSLWQKGYLF